MQKTIKKTHLTEGDNHIIYHVGSELPAKNENFLMVPGVREAQGRGVYFSEKPDLRYSGGEAFRKKMPVVPIFCIPMTGTWRQGENKHGMTTYHTEGRVVLMQDTQFFDVPSSEGLTLRYYYSFHPVFFTEPLGDHKGKFADKIREGKLSLNDAIWELMETRSEQRIPESELKSQLMKAIEVGIIPFDQNLVAEIKQDPATKEGKIWLSGDEKNWRGPLYQKESPEA